MENEESRMFQIDKSEEVTEGPTFFEKGLKLTDQPAQKIIVTQFQQESRPLGVIMRPYLEALMRGAGTAAGSAAGIGQQALSAISSALLWGYEGLKNLLSKTAEYVQPKFVLFTSRKEPSAEQTVVIDKLQHKKELAVLGIHELNELKEIGSDGLYRVAIPADQEFLNYLKNEKYVVRNKEWVDEADPTKSIVMPSESFTMLLNNHKEQEHQMQKKEVTIKGGFCMFDLEEKDAVEYEFMKKLKLSKDHIEGYLVRADDVLKRGSSHESSNSHPDNEGMLVVEEPKTEYPTDLLSYEQQVLLQEKLPVTVKEVPLQPQQEDSEKSKELWLA